MKLIVVIVNKIAFIITKCYVDLTIQGIPAFYSLLMAGHLHPEHSEKLNQNIGKMNEFLAKAATPYFTGARPGFSDYMIWPWFERMPMLGNITGIKLRLSSKTC